MAAAVDQQGNPIPQGTGFQFSGVTPNNQAKVKNVLSDEEIQKLIQKENVFSLAITETEFLRSICTHRYSDGRDALQENNGMFKCQICGHEFLPVDINSTPEDILRPVAEVQDIIQTIKLLFIDIPVPVAREFFQVIALLDKVPELFKHACKDYARHEGFIPGTYNSKMASVMNIYNMITGGVPMGPQVDQYGRPIDPGFSPYGMWAQGNPVYNPQQYVYGFANQQPMQYGAMNPPQGNFNFSGQPGTYQPQSTGYAYDPNQNQQGMPMNPPQGQPTTATAQPVTTEGVTEVKQTFKA